MMTHAPTRTDDTIAVTINGDQLAGWRLARRIAESALKEGETLAFSEWPDDLGSLTTDYRFTVTSGGAS